MPWTIIQFSLKPQMSYHWANTIWMRSSGGLITIVVITLLYPFPSIRRSGVWLTPPETSRLLHLREKKFQWLSHILESNCPNVTKTEADSDGWNRKSETQDGDRQKPEVDPPTNIWFLDMIHNVKFRRLTNWTLGPRLPTEIMPTVTK